MRGGTACPRTRAGGRRRDPARGSRHRQAPARRFPCVLRKRLEPVDRRRAGEQQHRVGRAEQLEQPQFEGHALAPQPARVGRAPPGPQAGCSGVAVLVTQRAVGIAEQQLRVAQHHRRLVVAGHPQLRAARSRRRGPPAADPCPPRPRACAAGRRPPYCGGESSWSTMRQATPRRRNSHAAVRPTGPPPTTSTSASSSGTSPAISFPASGSWRPRRRVRRAGSRSHPRPACSPGAPR